MIAVFFKLIFIILFSIFVIGCIMAVRLLRSFRNLSDRFKDFRNTADGPHNGGRGYSSGRGKETVVDRRSPEEAGKKIFSKTEGEYVDFEEED